MSVQGKVAPSAPLLAGDGANTSYSALVDDHRVLPAANDDAPRKRQGNNLSTMRGVYVPCVLGIFGVILFLRMGWAVGQVGVLETLGIMVVAAVVDIFTILSVSALVTNGRMKGTGGPYYMISRTLGPEFGGAVGLIFYLASAISVTFYVQGFVEVVFSAARLDFGSCYWMGIVVGSSVLLVVTLISLVGAGLFSRIAALILVVKMFSIAMGLGGLVIRSGDIGVPGFTGPSWGTFMDNVFPNSNSTDLGAGNNAAHDPGMCTGGGEAGDVTGNSGSFFGAFGILFPAFTGVMAGANLSGDLKDPAVSIPKGSLLGLGTAFLVYALVVIFHAMSVTQNALAVNTSIMEDVCWYPGFVSSGIFASTFASGLASMAGASRILQALARDDLLPFLSYFGQGSKSGDEPRAAVIATWFVAQCFLFVGNLNAIAPVVSMFFLLTYTMVNGACYAVDVSGTPNFRPNFQFFSWRTSLVGCIASLTVMFLLDWEYASIAVVVLLILLVIIQVRGPIRNEWGDISQALIFHQVRKYLLRLDERKEHARNWRPHLIVLFPDARRSRPLLQFANHLKKGGMYTIGNVLVGDLEQLSELRTAFHNSWLSFVDKLGLKSFIVEVVAPSIRVGAHTLVTNTGLGAFKPNTVVLEFATDVGCVDPIDTFAATPSAWNKSVSGNGNANGNTGNNGNDGSGSPSSTARRRRGNNNNNNKGDNNGVFNEEEEEAGQQQQEHGAGGSPVAGGGKHGGGDMDTSMDSTAAALWDEPKLAFGDPGSVSFFYDDYIGVVNDSLLYGKNVVLARNFSALDLDALFKKKVTIPASAIKGAHSHQDGTGSGGGGGGGGARVHFTQVADAQADANFEPCEYQGDRPCIDVWPVQLGGVLRRDDSLHDLTLQLGFVLHSGTKWYKSTDLRVKIPVLHPDDVPLVETRVLALLDEARIHPKFVHVFAISQLPAYQHLVEQYPSTTKDNADGDDHADADADADKYALLDEHMTDAQRAELFNGVYLAHSQYTAVCVMAMQRSSATLDIRCDRPLIDFTLQATAHMPPTLHVINHKDQQVFAPEY